MAITKNGERTKTMTTEEIKRYLESDLPDFTFRTNDNPGNEHKIWIERDGKHIVLDIQKVENKKAAAKLKEFIELKWSQSK